MEKKLNADYDAWAAKLEQLLPDANTDDEGWVARWFDGFTPEDAAAAGPEPFGA